MRGQHTDIQTYRHTDRQTEPNYDIEALRALYLLRSWLIICNKPYERSCTEFKNFIKSLLENKEAVYLLILLHTRKAFSLTTLTKKTAGRILPYGPCHTVIRTGCRENMILENECFEIS